MMRKFLEVGADRCGASLHPDGSYYYAAEEAGDAYSAWCAGHGEQVSDEDAIAIRDWLEQ